MVVVGWKVEVVVVVAKEMMMAETECDLALHHWYHWYHAFSLLYQKMEVEELNSVLNVIDSTFYLYQKNAMTIRAGV